MTNNTISLSHSAHGTYTVNADHLAQTMTMHWGNTLQDLHRRLEVLTGELASYNDLNMVEALVVISYLTGGIAD